MKISFSSLATPGFSSANMAELALRLGFDGIDLRFHDDDGDISLTASDEQIAVLRQPIIDANLSLAHILSYARPTHLSDPAQRNKIRQRWLQEADMAAKLGAEYLRLFLGVPAKEDAPSEHVKWVAEILNEIVVQISPDLGLIHQNHFTMSFDLAETIELLRLCSDTRIGLLYSPDHSFRVNEPWLQQLPMAAARVPSLCIYGTDESRVLVPGVRLIPEFHDDVYRQTLAILIKTQQPLWLSCKWECLYFPNQIEQCEEALPRFLRFARSLM